MESGPSPNASKIEMTGKLLFSAAFAAFSTFAASNIYDFTLNSITGQPVPLAQYKGKVVMLVNVASKCGYTPQYKGLEALYKKYEAKGLVILGFPANNFMSQEPGTNAEIQTFCSRTYNVTFPMFSKISVKGDDQAPLYQFLTDKKANPATGGEIGWNFTKFLVDRNGKIVARFDSKVEPESEEVTKAIEAALQQ
jgi:glutathione peroxidase